MEFITKQSKLTKTEWEGIEVPHSSDEINILRLISAGFSDVNINRNHAKTLLLYMKIKNTPYIDLYLYKQYFETALLRRGLLLVGRFRLRSFSVGGRF